MNTKIVVVPIILIVMLTSCLSWFSNESTEQVEANIDSVSDITREASKGVVASADKVEVSAKDIKTEAGKIQKKVGNKANIGKEVGKIHSNADIIIDESTKLKIISGKLDSAVIQLDETKKQLDKIQNQITMMQGIIKTKDKKIKDLQSSMSDAAKEKMWWAIFAGIGLIGLASILVVNGNSKAIALGIGGIVVVIIAIAVACFLKIFAIIGLAFVVVALIAAGFKFKEINHQKTYENGFRELVHVIEVIKDLLTDEERIRIFGDRMHPGSIDSIETPKTKSLVLITREEERGKWEPTINHQRHQAPQPIRP
jgi:hypothetical protein